MADTTQVLQAAPSRPPVAPDAAELAARARPALSWKGMAWPIGLSLIAIGIAIGVTWEPGAFETIARSLRPGFLLLAVLALTGQVGFAGARIRYVSRGRVPYRKAVRAELTWEFLSGITPSAIGGGPMTGLFIARENRLSIGEATAMMLYLMLADQAWFVLLVPTILFAATQLPIFPESLGTVGASTITLYLLGLMGWAAFFAWATLFRPQVLTSVARAVVRIRPLRRFEKRVGEEATRLQRQSRILRGRSPLFFLGAVGLSACVWSCRYLVLLFVAWAVVPGLPVLTFLLRSAALWLSTLILPTPGGAGGIEGLYLLYLGPLLPAGFAGPALLTWRLLSYYLVLAVGFGIAGSTLREMLFGDRSSPPSAMAANTSEDGVPAAATPEAP